MADPYQNRPFPTDAYHDRGANVYVRGESDPPDGSLGRRRLSGSGLLAEERGRRAGLLPRAAN